MNDHGRELTPAELERQGRAALGRPVTAQAERSRVDSVSGPSQAGATAEKPQGPRSPQQIEADIEQARANLAVTLDEIVDRVKPANVVKRAQERVRAQFIDSDTGAPRTERILPVAGGAAGLVLLVVLVKRRRKR